MFTSKYKEINQENYKINAVSHAKFNLKATLFLAYRDTTCLLKKHLIERNKKDNYKFLDYGCGTGLSTSMYSKAFSELGYTVDVFGVDISAENIAFARENVPEGTFVHIDEKNKFDFEEKFDLIVCNFVLLEQTRGNLKIILNNLRKLVNDNGVIIITNASRQSYDPLNKWYTLNNNFPQNLAPTSSSKIQDGQKVSLAVKDPQTDNELFQFYDFFYSKKTYINTYKNAGFNLIETYKPLGKESDGIPWKSETHTSPYKIQVLYPEIENPCLGSELRLDF